MTVSEFAFLGLGLVLGIAIGAAIVEFVRGRPSAAREVRVTVAPGTVPKRRSATLAEDAFAGRSAGPARGGPADHPPSAEAGEPVPDRTPVRSDGHPPPTILHRSERPVVGIPIQPETDHALESLRASAARTAEEAIADQHLSIEAVLERRARVPVPSGVIASTARAGAAGSVAGTRSPTAAAGGRTAEPDSPSPAPPAADAAAAPQPTTSSVTDEECAALRRAAEERCTAAGRAREQATAAQEALRAAQRAYDDHQTTSERAAVEADPRYVRTAKDAAQNAFRLARAAAKTDAEIEAAARDWLTEINRINHEARDAAARVRKERHAAAALVLQLERLAVEADGARISAESADAECIAAREAVAQCQEAAARTQREPVATGRRQAFLTALGSEDGHEPAAASSDQRHGEPAFVRLLRRDQETTAALANILGGSDTTKRQHWQAALAQFVDAVVGRAIETSKLTFSLDHPFWGAFTLDQNRDVVTALSSLGYRYDGVGGWLDDRIPGQRDLALAVGYAGLDPMRVRRWPNESEMRQLFQGVEVAADEFLLEAAAGLTLGKLVDALGSRADDLTELWNEWGRVRPLLLAEA